MIALIVDRESLGKQAAGVNHAFKSHALGKEDIQQLSTDEKDQLIRSKKDAIDVIAKAMRDDVSDIRKNISQDVAMIGGSHE